LPPVFSSLLIKYQYPVMKEIFHHPFSFDCTQDHLRLRVHRETGDGISEYMLKMEVEFIHSLTPLIQVQSTGIPAEQGF